MTLNALAIDPKRTWKGVWRWFDETLLDCCKPLDEVIRMNGRQCMCSAALTFASFCVVLDDVVRCVNCWHEPMVGG